MNSSHAPLEALDTLEIEKLRALAKARGVKKREADRSSIPAVSRDGALPLSFAQQALWFLAQSAEISAIYHIPIALRLRGDLDRAVLRRGLDALVARHEALRSIFACLDGQPRVEILPSDIGLPLVEQDLRGTPDASTRLAQLAAEEARAAFDLAHGPLIRARLIRMADEEHVFLLTQHHIVSDGWSLGIFAQELGALYRAFRAGLPDPLPPLAIQYPDYAAWQRTWLTGDRLQRQADYWRHTLADAPALLELPTDRPRPPQQRFAGASVPMHLDRDLTQALAQLSERHGTTLFITVLSAWAAVLARLSGQDDVVIGTPTANRGRHETEGLMGCFVNTLALRVDLTNRPRVADLLARVRAAALSAQEHQDLPFEQVVEIVQPPRRTQHTPLFQVLFAWQNVERGVPDLPGLRVEPADTAHEVARFDLKLDLYEEDGGIAGELLYATALFDEATVLRHRGYLIAQLRAMAADPEQRVATIELLAPAERTLLVETWNATETASPAHQCIHTLFEECVRQTPTATAVVYEAHALTYAELDAQANRLAHHLIDLGVRPDARVAIAVERGLGLVIGLLAILKAGGAYVPLDPVYPSERLAQILADASPAVVLADEAGRAALGEAALRDRILLDLDDLGQAGAPPSAWAERPASAPDPQALGLTASHLAYVIYTSGSTGVPKGVMVEHRAVANFDAALRATIYPPARVPRRIGWNASYAFDMSIKGLSQLFAGHCLIVIPQRVRADAAAFLTFLRAAAIDAFDTTPSQLKVLIAAGLLADPTPRTVLLGGESVEPALWAQLRDAPALTVHNMYGPTECTVDATIGAIRPDDEVPHIGRPVANTQIYLLDDEQQPVPLGAIGEIYIGGAGLARGYLHSPELTAERFVRNPFSIAAAAAARPGAAARLYKTGDLARYLPDGRLAFLGRNDHQIKIRGFRVDLGEIEARLAEHPLVREAVVLARENEADETRLVAYVVPAGACSGDTDPASGAGVAGAAPTDLAAWAGLLRTHLAARLPDYMVPAAFVRLAALPLTPNGKLDRAALPASEEEVQARREYEAPEGETEAALAALWQELLGLERIGRHDRFFDLGGHSLMAVRLLIRVRQTLGVELPMAVLFAQPTIAQLAQFITEAGASGVLQALPPIETVSRDAPLPLSFAQQRLWFLAQLQDVSATYHIPAALRLHGDLDRVVLRRSLDALVARHEALRSIFVVVDGEPRVELLPIAVGLPIIEQDLRGLPDAAARLAHLAVEEARAPFDLSRGPLIRARLIQLDTHEHMFLLTQHHIVSDGWSLGIFAQELGALYRAFREGRPDPLPPLATQYPDYAAWQRAWLSGERLQQQTAYWRQTLADAPALLELPTDRPRPPQQSLVGAHVPVTIDRELTAALQQLSARHGTTLFMTVLAAWAAVLGRLAGQEDLVIGVPTANRRRRETEGVMGFFVNTLAVRVDLADGPRVADLLARVRTTMVAAQEHQDLPFEQVVEIVQPPRRLQHTPLFQVLFAWQNTERGVPDLPGIRVEADGTAYGVSRFDLELVLYERGGIITGGLHYATALFDQATILRHRGYLTTLLQAMVADADQIVSAIELPAPDERTQLIETFNATERPYADHLCIHELFEAQVRRTPGAVAVVAADQSISYGELNAQANRLAHHLIDLGVRPGDRVAICVDRGVGMVIGVMAVVKAGGAYVPLNAAYPSDRLAEMLADAAPAIVLIDDAGREAIGADPLARLTVLDLEALRPGHAPPPWAARPDTDIDPRALGLTAQHLAYVIYTSGSTGTPKGVMGFHQPVINLIEWVTREFEVGARDVMLFTASLSFDLSVYDIFGLLAVGGSLRVASQQDVADPQRLARLLFEDGVTFWDSAPAVFQQLIHCLDDAARPGHVPSLRLAFFSGDWIPLEFFSVIRRVFPACHMISLGGATEATVWSNFHPVDRLDPAWVSIPYGRPIQNARYYVLDEHLHPVPSGVRGNLYIGGECLTAGYFNRPELTAERFPRDPFRSTPGARMYKTGDVARHLPEGPLEFLGRNDHQVKIRGFRVELGEIEARLAEHPLVREAVVLARGESRSDKRLVAYVVPTSAVAADEASETSEASEDAATEPGSWASALRTHLAARLPDYMVPAAFVRLAALPVTPNGKLDRAALPAPEDDAYAVRRYEAPQGGVEQALADIWRDLLGVERVGRHDQFFELGGHSLLALQLVDRLRRASLHVDVRTVFAMPTLSDMAATIGEVEEIRL